MKIFRGIAFYVLLAVVLVVVILVPIENQLAIMVLLEFLTKDLQKVRNIVNSFQVSQCAKMYVFQFAAVHDKFIPWFDWDDSGNRCMANES